MQVFSSSFTGNWNHQSYRAAMASKGYNNAISISKVDYILPALRNCADLPQKLTQGSTGFFETLRKFLAVDPNRSNGIPVKAFRSPTPGGLDPTAYDDPTTVPAADIADNPYWRRDVRRNYPKLSAVTQPETVGLLTMGSAAKPSPKLLAGEEGQKQLVAVKDEGQRGLSAYFDSQKGAAVLSEGGLPPMPVPARSALAGAQDYKIGEDQSYKDE